MNIIICSLLLTGCHQVYLLTKLNLLYFHYKIILSAIKRIAVHSTIIGKDVWKPVQLIKHILNHDEHNVIT